MHDKQQQQQLASLKALLFDCDGVLWRGEQALPGARELISRILKENSFFLLLVTNNSTLTRQEFADKANRQLELDGDDRLRIQPVNQQHADINAEFPFTT